MNDISYQVLKEDSASQDINFTSTGNQSVQCNFHGLTQLSAQEDFTEVCCGESARTPTHQHIHTYTMLSVWPTGNNT